MKDNAAAAATTLTIRHSRFATLTLAKLVASLALHPPVSATGSGGLRASPPPTAEPLLKEKPFGSRSLQQSIAVALDFRIQLFAPVTRRCNRRGAGEARPGGAAVPPSSYINLTFSSYTGSLLLSSLKKVTSSSSHFVSRLTPAASAGKRPRRGSGFPATGARLCRVRAAARPWTE